MGARRTIALLIALVLCTSLAGAQNSKKTVTLLVVGSGSHMTYQVTSTGSSVTSRPGDTVQLLTALGKAGTDARLAVLVDKRATVDDILGLEVVVGKVGFEHARWFCFDKNDQTWIAELTIGSSRPFTLTPY